MAAILLAVLALPAGAAARADLVLHDGVVWTGDDDAPAAQAVAIAGDRIAAVGPDAAVMRHAGPRTRVLDLNGAFVAPAFADQHVHVLEDPTMSSLRPSWSGYDPAAAEAFRAAILGYHSGLFAARRTPEDGCTTSTVTESLKNDLAAAQEELARQGIGSVVEAGLSDLAVLEALRQLEREGRMRVRFLVRVGWGCIEQAAAMGLRTGSGSEWTRILGVKLYSDGWLGPRSAALREPYGDRPHDGYLFLDQDRANADVARARQLGFNVTTHAIGDRGLATTLAAYRANGVTKTDRYSVEHAQVLGEDLIAEMERLGVVASIQLSFATTDQRFAESALGPERAARSYAWRTLDQRGIRLAGGSDFPVEVVTPLWGLQRVVTRREFDGTPPGGWHPDQRFDVPRALRLITADDAYASLEDRRRGRVEAGRFADLVVVRENLLELPQDCIAAATVLLTVVNGRVTFEGEQAYPPGDATCPSGRAPAKEPRIAPGAALRDGRAPRVSLKVGGPSARGLRRARRLRVAVRVDEPATAAVRMRVGGAPIVRRRGIRIASPGRRTVTVALTRRARRALRRGGRLAVSARAVDAAGNAGAARAVRRLR
ncbi:MAG TPA: amidohydrolase family protein [Thermoleophilaceae bacterium]|nr:amidohydrolase family protein [Thermoleophilaceae bacterium]